MSSNYIGLMAAESPSLLVGLLGILKSGQCLMPINPSFPDERLRHVILDCGVRVLVTDKANHSRGTLLLRECSCLEEVICIDDIDFAQEEELPKETAGVTGNDPIKPLISHTPCYVIYTSGSTGKPKGVEISHENLVPLLSWFIDYFGLHQDTRVLQNLSYTFDFGIFELLTTLFTGGALFFLDKAAVGDVNDYVDFIYRHDINTLHTTPSFYTNIASSGRNLSPLELLHLGGEKVTGHMIESTADLLDDNCIIYNGYGPTETTINSAVFRITPQSRKAPAPPLPLNIPIGQPSAQNSIYILDAYGNLQPPGLTGELYIGGGGMAAGYTNRPELTAERFSMPSATKTLFEKRVLESQKLLFSGFAAKTQKTGKVPGEKGDKLKSEGNDIVQPHEVWLNKSFDQTFSKVWPPAGTGTDLVLYRTGDLGRWLPGGDIEFLGRIDHQVKVRGFRIELGEIEKQLLQYEEIGEAVVLARRYENGENYLCAYIVIRNDSIRQTFLTDLKNYLSQRLPGYMVPAFFVVLDKMPLNPSGKIDLKALPGPDATDDGQDYIAPRDAVEAKLVQLYREVLGIETGRLGIDADFFEYGGHSLKATQLLSKIHKAFDVNLALSELFARRTARNMATCIKEATADKYISIEPAPEKEYYELSSAQRRIYLLQQINLENTAYNIPSFYHITGNLDLDRLQEVFRSLIERHESFRTSFHMIDDQAVQHIHAAEKINFELHNLQEIPSNGAGICQSTNGKLGCTRASAAFLNISRSSGVGSTAQRHPIHNFIRPFDLSVAPLLRVGLVKEEDEKYLLMIDMHHIISDGTSAGILVKEFMALYSGAELPQLRIQYKDYAEWQNSPGAKEGIAKQGDFWRDQFSGEIPILNLPTDYPRPTTQDFAGSTLPFDIGEKETHSLERVATERGATVYMVLLSAFTLFLSKLSGQEDIVLGTPVAGRRHPDLEPIIGMFVNTLALRNFPHGDKTFVHFLEEVKERTLAAFENQDYPFEDLVEQVDVQRDTGRNPLFDVMFTFQDLDIPSLDIPGLKISPAEYESKIAKFDLSLTVVKEEKNLLFVFRYSTKLFKKETIERFIDYFKKILTQLPAVIDKKLSTIGIITGEEKKKILDEFNDTGSCFFIEKTIHRAFLEQVNKTPDRLAVVGPAHHLDSPYTVQVSYKELDETSTAVSKILKSRGIGPDTIAAIMVERSVEMITGMMAILKADGAYLPIEPGFPEDRINYLLKDSKAKLLLTLREGLEIDTNPGECPVEKVYLDEIFENKENFTPGKIEHTGSYTSEAEGKNIAYVIYTSGTTGKPKGVMIEHHSVINLVQGLKGIFSLGKEPLHVALVAPIIFDASIKQVFPTLHLGHTLHIVPKGTHIDGEKLIDFYRSRDIDITDGTPAHLSIMLSGHKHLLENLPVNRFVTGGDELLATLCDQFISSVNHEQFEIVNVYGPTECCDVSTLYTIKNSMPRQTIRSIPIGKPLANVKIYILDQGGHLQPPGLTGELVIAGAGRGRGYLNNPELTADRFIASGGQGLFLKDAVCRLPRKGLPLDPAKTSVQPLRGKTTIIQATSHHTTLYKTGDLCRWLHDGTVEFLGRIDQQVKIRGFRIELGEIENRLLSHEAVEEAVVIDRKAEDGEKYLCAYFVTVSPGEEGGCAAALEGGPARAFGDYLSNLLPDYMIPSFFVEMENIPLTPNGKVDRKALPEPGVTVATPFNTPPRDALEEKLVEIWAHILGIEKEKIGIDSNFFHMGGHSLKATLLVSQVHKAFHVSVPLAEIFVNPTIRQLSGTIREGAGVEYIAIPAVEKKEYYKVSSAQRRLYLMDTMYGQGTAYNIPGIYVLEGKLDVAKLEHVFQQLIARHASFRTSFHLIDGQPVQQVAPAPSEPPAGAPSKNTAILQEIPSNGGVLALASGVGSTAQRHPIHQFIQPFNLSNAPLLRVGLVKEEDEKHLLLLDMHHIITDGVSTGILVKDFMDLYSGKELSPLRIQYKDFSEWQQDSAIKQAIERQGDYWRERFSGEIPILNLPTDYPRPTVQDYSGASLSFDIGEEETRSLNNLAREHEVTLYMLLLAAYTLWLAKLSGQEDIIIGTPIAGRRHADLENIIGMFVSTIALRNFPHGEKTFGEFLGEVKESTLAAFENQDYPFEELVEQVDVQRDSGRNPLFDVMFTLQNLDIPVFEVPNLKLSKQEYDSKIAKFDLTLFAFEIGSSLHFSIEYSTKLFKKERIETFSDYFKNLLKNLPGSPSRQLSSLKIISNEEKKKILYDVNDTFSHYPSDKTIYQLFSEQVEKAPAQTAVVFKDQAITYQELDNETGHLSAQLIERGVQPGDIVAVILHRSIPMITTIWGILKAGAAYLPMEPDSPQERIDYMLSDSCAKLLVSGDNILNRGLQGLARSKERESYKSPRSGAYVIYTSGSTGQPKGVMVEHRNVVRLVKNTNYIEIVPSDRLLQLSNYAFDGSVFDIYGALLNGATLALIAKDEVADLKKLSMVILKESITVFFLTTALFNTLVDMDIETFRNTRKILFGGEQISLVHSRKALEYLGKGRLIHVYGPTETTVYSTFYFIDQVPAEAVTIPIGKPLANATTYILDKYYHPVPPGIAGELTIGGDGMALGYLNNPELTATNFLKKVGQKLQFSGFAAGRGAAPRLPAPRHHITLYRTGDLCCWTDEGDIEFIGRIDHQVKLRGFRIELGEIEACLLEHEAVKEAIVIVRGEGSGDRNLCAYYVAGTEDKGDGAGTLEGDRATVLKEYLSSRLPAYMVPSFFVELEKFPLNANGKIDRKALPQPGTGGRAGEINAPRDEMEISLAGIWSELLKIEKENIGRDMNFFVLGGHSLTLATLVSKIENTFNIRLPMADIFNSPTIAGIASLLSSRQEPGPAPGGVAGKKDALVPIEKREYYELSYTQRRIEILQRLDPSSSVFNMTGRIEFNEEVDERILREVLGKLAQRHEAFRTYFKEENGQVRQFLLADTAIQVESIDISNFAPPEREEQFRALLDAEAQLPFDLSAPPLVRAKLVKFDCNNFKLIFTMHHIISDGWSMDILRSEFLLLHEAYKQGKKDTDEDLLPPLRISYKDYAAWHNRLSDDEEAMTAAKNFWKNHFSGQYTRLRLPYDYASTGKKRSNSQPASAGGSEAESDAKGRSAGYHAIIPAQTVERLRSIAGEQNASLFIVLLTGFNVLLSQISSQPEVLVGFPGASRQQGDIAGVIGLFANTLILQSQIDEDEPFTRLLDRVKNDMVQVLEYQSFPLELIFSELKINYPEIQVFFNMFSLADKKNNSIGDDRLLEAYHIDEVQEAKFDLTWYLSEYKEGVTIGVHYKMAAFKPLTVEKIVQKYLRLLDEISKNPGQVTGAGTVSTKEKRKIKRIKRPGS